MAGIFIFIPRQVALFQIAIATELGSIGSAAEGSQIASDGKLIHARISHYSHNLEEGN